jgi:hypothetical protein
LGREIGSGIEKVDCRNILRIGLIERFSGQQFIKIPDTASGNTGRRCAYQIFDCIRRNGIKDAFEDEKIKVFVSKGECQVIRQGISGPVSLVEDAPSAFSPLAAFDILFRDKAGPPNGRADG